MVAIRIGTDLEDRESRVATRIRRLPEIEMRFSVGQELDGLEIVRVLRPSKRSVAYIVRDVVSQRLEYLKLVPEQLQNDNEAYQRFLREAKVHAGLSHPNIAQFYSVRRLDGELVMTREWIEGKPLESKITEGPLSVPQAVDYIGQALLALDNAHGQGVIHRDITPASLLITENGIVKLTGFELARSPNDPRLTGTGVVLGNVHYMAPEHVQGLAQAEERSDLYACGIVLYEAVTGRRPFERKSDFDVMLAQVKDPVPSPRALNEMISPGLEQVILRALEKEPKNRFQSAREFHDLMLAEAHAKFQMTLHVPEAPEARAEPAIEPAAEPESRAHREFPVQPESAVQPEPAGQLESVVQPAVPAFEPQYSTAAFIQESGDISRMIGIAIACFSVGVLVFLAMMIMMGR
jgi:eukaryotic-like serine/threonine-protein kinase